MMHPPPCEATHLQLKSPLEHSAGWSSIWNATSTSEGRPTLETPEPWLNEKKVARHSAPLHPRTLVLDSGGGGPPTNEFGKFECFSPSCRLWVRGWRLVFDLVSQPSSLSP